MNKKYQNEINKIKDKIMSTSQAANLWGLHQDTIKRLCRTGKIAAIKLDSDDPKSPYLILRNQPSPINKDTI